MLPPGCGSINPLQTLASLVPGSQVYTCLLTELPAPAGSPTRSGEGGLTLRRDTLANGEKWRVPMDRKSLQRSMTSSSRAFFTGASKCAKASLQAGQGSLTVFRDLTLACKCCRSCVWLGQNHSSRSVRQQATQSGTASRCRCAPACFPAGLHYTIIACVTC